MSKIIIPFNYLPFEFKNTKIIFNDWNKLIKSTEFTLGSYVKSFEKKFASYTKSKYCISTNNGTDALILALKSLDIKKGDEVITVCNTFYATVGAIVSVGAKPILVDSEKELAPFASVLFETIYSSITILPSDNAVPNTPSPK